MIHFLPLHGHWSLVNSEFTKTDLYEALVTGLVAPTHKKSKDAVTVTMGPTVWELRIGLAGPV